MGDTDINELLKRFFAGTITPEEKETLSGWIQEAGNDSHFASLMERSWEQFQPGQSLDSNQANQLLQSILQEAKQREPARGKPIALRSRVWYRISAAAAVIIVLFGIYLFSKHNTAKNLVEANVPTVQDIPAPANTNAVITLANGAKILLDSITSGPLATEGNMRITKSAEGQILYNKASAEAAPETMYNTLTNPRGSKTVSVVLADGTKVWLNAESVLRYPAVFAGNERKVEVKGEAYFEVAHNKSMPFKVKKGNMEITVLGTHFNVNAYDDEETMKITLLEGSIKLTADSGQQPEGHDHSTILAPGQQARVSAQGDIALVKNADTDEVIAWKNGRFSFNNKDIETIMRQIARWYNVEIEYKEKITDTYSVNITRDVPVSKLFHFIQLSGGVHFEIDGRKIILKK